MAQRSVDFGRIEVRCAGNVAKKKKLNTEAI